ncbi:MAG TPA: glycosyltransferase family 4 protein [Vicinamibacterales bacterium]|nr:glycosyltransferase family 4 protein [Vicinamibacterales bacterium]
MRIAYITPSLDDTTGWGRWANDFLRHIRAAGVEPVVLAPPSSQRCWPAGSGEAHFVLPELFDYVQSSSGIERLLTARKVWSVRRRLHGLAMVHSLDAHPWGIYGDWIARSHAVPHVVTTHGRYGYIAENRLVDRVLYSRVLRRAAAMVAVSAAVGRAVTRTFGRALDPSRLVVLQNPVDESQFGTIGALPGQVPASGPVIVSVTRFIPVKDIETAVRAFRLVREQVPDATYFIVGPGNGEHNAYHRSIRDLIARESIAGVHIVGRVSKDVLTAFYKRASLLVHAARTLPDDFEASGLILLEAGLMGVPAVATASGGIPEVVEDGVTGRLVPEGDAAALGRSVVELLKNPEELRRLGEGNRVRARQRNWPAYCAEQMRLYQRVTQSAEK